MSGSVPQTGPSPVVPVPHIPAAVRRQAEAADAAMQRLRQPAPEGGDQQGAQPQEGQDQRPEGQDQQGAEPNRQDGQPQQEGQQPAQQDGQGVNQQGSEADWEHRLRSAEGRHRAEMARLQGRLDSLQGLLANLQSNPQASQSVPQNQPREAAFGPPEDAQLSEQDKRDYGDDLLGVMRKVALQAAYEAAAKVRAELQEVAGRVGNVQSTVQTTVKDRFWSEFRTLVPDFDALNVDENFLEWLRQEDPYSGQQRQILLSGAVEAGNARRAAVFFETYKREAGLVAPQAPQPQTPQQPAQQRPANGRVPLEQLAAPGRVKSGPGSSGPQAQKPVYTRQQVREFFEDVRRGKFPGTPEQRAWTEQDIIAAGTEGRIR